ncbi:MAG TPA: penicillin-binding protein 2 [Nevskiaceae bacterium]|nr:penicillin-binding protein 2 [Nevskiaceae bacterium]
MEVSPSTVKAIERARIWYVLVLLVMTVFFVRLFYLQVIRYDHYRNLALSDQLKQYEIPASRGTIKAHQGSSVVPIVLNQQLFSVYVDPTLVKDAGQAAETLANVLGGDANAFEKKLKTKHTRYVVLAKKVSEDKKKSILKHKYPGIGAMAQDYRVYPDGALASQLLGFVNNDGKGVYGIEQSLQPQLAGSAGKLKAVTDINGIPLAANTDNTLEQPVAGKDVVLTIDMAVQKQLETILQQGLKSAKSDSGSALIMDPRTGAIKAMANWPTYDPGNYGAVEDANVFNNAAVSSPLEVGSIMKPLTAAAALDQGVVKANTSYYDPASWKIDGYKITNIEEDGGAGTKSIADILNLSLNTGATWLLMQMGGHSEQVNQKGRTAWYSYMTDHYQFGKPTGIEQGYEAEGYIPSPNTGYGLDLTYANTSFGQGMTATPVQMGAALSAVINGGTYYRPRLVDQTIAADGKATAKKPEIVKSGVVSPQVSQEMQGLMAYIVKGHGLKFNTNYVVGGKTGTAQIAKSGGGYHDNEFNGTYMGFVGGDSPQYVVVVRVNQPHNGGYAGTAAAQPIFSNLVTMLINNFGVAPKTR